MVDIQFYKINKSAESFVVVLEDRLLFALPNPTVIQSSEIIKIKTGTVMKIPRGYVLTIYTPPDLAKQACELFPGVTVIDGWGPEVELELAVKNSGRNQVNLLAGNTIAVGYLSKVDDIGVGELELDVVANPKLPGTRPQKKNSFNFEVK